MNLPLSNIGDGTDDHSWYNHLSIFYVNSRDDTDPAVHVPFLRHLMHAAMDMASGRSHGSGRVFSINWSDPWVSRDGRVYVVPRAADHNSQLGIFTHLIKLRVLAFFRRQELGAFNAAGPLNLQFRFPRLHMQIHPTASEHRRWTLVTGPVKGVPLDRFRFFCRVWRQKVRLVIRWRRWWRVTRGIAARHCPWLKIAKGNPACIIDRS